MSKKSKSTTNQTTHTVVTPTNPEWVTAPVQNLAGRITDLGRLDPQSLVAGPTALQTEAAKSAAALGVPSAYGRAHDLFNTAADGAAPVGSASSLLDGLDRYLIPYLGSVVDGALRDYDVGAGQTRAQNSLALANDETFGGSGGAIQTALSNDAITRGRGTLSSQLLNQGYQTAANLSNMDAQRRQDMELANIAAYENSLQRKLAAGTAMAGAAGQESADARASIATQASIGDMMRQIEAAKATAPISLLATQSGLLNSLPLGLFHGETQDGNSTSTTTTKSSDPIGAVTSLATGLGSLMGIPFDPGTLGGILVKGIAR